MTAPLCQLCSSIISAEEFHISLTGIATLMKTTMVVFLNAECFESLCVMNLFSFCFIFHVF